MLCKSNNILRKKKKKKIWYKQLQDDKTKRLRPRVQNVVKDKLEENISLS